jgi:cytochrome P450
METGTRPPGPDLSKLAAVRAFRNDPIALLERLATYGDVVRVDVPGSAAFLLNHPDLVRDVLVTEHRSFHKGPTIRAAKMLLGESLLTSEDETHLRQRRLIQPMFHHERIATYAASMVRSAERAAERWSDGDELDVQAEMSALTLAVVSETLFGTDVDAERSATVRRALTDTLGMFDRVYSPLFRLLVRLPSPTMRRYHRVESDLNRVIAEMIAERRAGGATGDDLLSLLLRVREDGAGMTDEQVRDEALTLFLAGHETTAIALTWTWWLLARNPDAETGLQSELDTVLPDHEPSVEDLPNLPYTHAVISESIRLRPPAWAMGRTAISGHRANGYPIAKGSTVVVSPWLLHHDPRWWPDPEAFRPSAGSSRTPSDRGMRSSRSAAVRACASASRSRGWRQRCSSRRSHAGGGSRAGATASRTCRPSSRYVRAGDCRCGRFADATGPSPRERPRPARRAARGTRPARGTSPAAAASGAR